MSLRRKDLPPLMLPTEDMMDEDKRLTAAGHAAPPPHVSLVASPSILAQHFVTATARQDSPFHHAAREDRCRALQAMLVVYPEGPTLRDRLECIPLHYAANKKRFDTMKLLVHVASYTLLWKARDGTNTIKFAKMTFSADELRRAVNSCDIDPVYKAYVAEVDILFDRPAQ